MRIGPFITFISSTFGVPERTTTLVARAMREAGWLSSGARGVNAPHMTSTDGARLSIALLTGEPPSTVVEVFEFVRTLQSKDALPEDTLVETGTLGERHTFEQFLVALFDAIGSPDWKGRHGEPFLKDFRPPYFTVCFDASCREAQVRCPNFNAEYVDIEGQEAVERLGKTRPMDFQTRETIAAIEERSKRFSHGMQVVRTITGDEIVPLATALIQDDLS